MAEVTITINSRTYEIGCDDGQEGRIVELASYIDKKLQMIARSGAAYNDAHLMVLTSLVLADEVFDSQAQASAKPAPSKSIHTPSENNIQEEQALAGLLEQITNRIDGIAARVQAA